jgi:hypothetical protein
MVPCREFFVLAAPALGEVNYGIEAGSDMQMFMRIFDRLIENMVTTLPYSCQLYYSSVICDNTIMKLNIIVAVLVHTVSAFLSSFLCALMSFI